MKVQKKLSSNIIVEAEGATLVDVFKQLAQRDEIFSATPKCGLCGSDRLRHVVRKVKSDNNEHFEVHCLNPDCRARFVFGQNKEPKGALFPQRHEGKGASKKLKPNGGWSKFVPNADDKK